MDPQLHAPRPSRHPTPTARATSLAYLVFERPDLVRAEAFLSDFGLGLTERTHDVVTLRGTGAAPYVYRIHRGARARFVGAGFTVGSRAELLRLAALPGASPVAQSPHPGGGEFVALRDPSGFSVEVVFGQATTEPLPTRPPMTFNVGPERLRIDAPQRPPLEPPDVLRLGHVVYEVADFQATCAWYTEHLGFIPSDTQLLPDGSPAVVFLRLDRGPTPTDHHTLALAQGVMPVFSHAAFELVDPDAVGVGQRVLREGGWAHAWGIGRHILGSQIFDYWKDPWGDKHEHYCDGDLVTAEVPMGVHPVSRDAMSQWGPPMPRSFTKPVLGPRTLLATVHSLRHSPDLDLKKLGALVRVFG